MSIPLELGTNVVDGEPFTFWETGGYGNIGVISMPRVGKSKLVKALSVLQSNHANRQVIIWDYGGDHAKSIYPNYDFPMGNYPRYCEGLPPDKTLILENIAYTVSEFAHPNYWISLGMPGGVSYVIAKVARHTKVHNEEPKKVLDILYNLPTTNEDINDFAEEYYPLKFSRVHEETAKASPTHFSKVLRFFKSTDEIEKKNLTKIPDFGELALRAVVQKEMVRHPNIIINLDIEEGEQAKYGLFAGKMLYQLTNYITQGVVRPVLIFEEADKLIPNLNNIEQMSGVPYSIFPIKNLARRHQRYGVKMIFITHKSNYLDLEVVRSMHHWFLGVGSDDPIGLEIGGHRISELIKNLKWDADINYREFLYMRIGKQRFTVFAPHLSPCE